MKTMEELKAFSLEKKQMNAVNGGMHCTHHFEGGVTYTESVKSDFSPEETGRLMSNPADTVTCA